MKKKQSFLDRLPEVTLTGKASWPRPPRSPAGPAGHLPRKTPLQGNRLPLGSQSSSARSKRYLRQMGGGWAESLECLPEWGLDNLQGSGHGEDIRDPSVDMEVTHGRMEDGNQGC